MITITKCSYCFKEVNPWDVYIIRYNVEAQHVYHIKCYDLRDEVPETWKDKLIDWVIHLFPETLKDLTTASRLEGFEEGYRLSGKTGQELKQIGYQLARFEEQQAQLILQILKNNFPNV